MDVIMKYLTLTLKQSVVLAQRNYKKITKYEDVKKEFICCIENDDIPMDGIQVEGYSAKDIQQLAPFMNYLGVYNFLVSLRDNPDNAKQIIDDEFKIK